MKLILIFTLLTNITFAMEYVQICKTKTDCKQFSKLVMGTDHLIQADWVYPGWPGYSDAKAFEVMDHAANLGINFFDTSPIYVGGVEYRLGLWREQRKLDHPNQDIHVLSKGGFPFDLYWSQSLPEGEHSAELRKRLPAQGQFPAGTYASRLFGSVDLIRTRVAEEMGHSLNNLKNDITIYLMHRDDADAVGFKEVKRKQTSIENILSALSEPEIADNAWMFGWSNWHTERVDNSLSLAKKNREYIQPVINSPYFSLFEMTERSIHALGVQVTHEEMMDPNFQKGIKIMPYSPLGGFSILDKPRPKWENAKADALKKKMAGDPYWQNVYSSLFESKENELRWHRVVKFTKKFNQTRGTSYTVDQMLNAYVLAHPRTDLLAVGPITKEQLDRTVKSLDLAKLLTKKDLDYLYYGVTK